MAFSEYALLISTGIAAGLINTVAGGGSLLTLPLLIFMGLPAAEANASNRVAIIIQNIFAVKGFKSKGVAVFPFAYWVSISATLGALLGAYLATEISNTFFNKILSIVMVFVLVITVLKPYLDKKEALERFTKKRNLISILLFFGIGIYGGFINAGIGIVIMFFLTKYNRLSLVKTNAAKVALVGIYTLGALLLFAYNNKVNWSMGLWLSFGTIFGAWFTSRYSVRKGEKIIKFSLLFVVVSMAVKLWFF